MSRNVLVTGGAGFIGRELVRNLIKFNYHVTSFDVSEQFSRHKEFFNNLDNSKLLIHSGSILDKTALRSAFKNVDTVIHLAAMLGVKKTESNRLSCMEINVSGTENVLNACVLDNVKKIIFASSSEVYGEPSHNPISEDDETKGKTVYAVSKLAGEELVKGYNQLNPKLKYTIVRFFNTYGEGQVAQFVLTRFVNNVLRGENPIVYGSGSQVRSYGHVEDVTNGLMEIIENSISDNKIYNLGNSNQVMTLVELANKVIEVLAPDQGIKVDVLGSFDGSDRHADREIHTRYCDTSLAFSDFGYSPKIDIEEGIQRIAAQSSIDMDWPTV